MLPIWSRQALILCLLGLPLTAQAQLATTFSWTWSSPGPSSSTLQECEKYRIILGPPPDGSGSKELAVPPFYMLALEAGGVATTSLIGSNSSDLWWQANHKKGSTLMLAVVDSNGTTGGVGPDIYTMAASNGDASCIAQTPSSLAAIHPNVTGNLQTCSPWGLTITGGDTPYTVLFAQPSSETLTVVTMEKGNDLLTYINRGNPSNQIMAAVYDATGKWGTSTAAISTSGPIQVDCGDSVTQQGSSNGGAETEVDGAQIVVPIPSGTSVSPPEATSTGATKSGALPGQTTTAAADHKSHASTALIAGVALGVGVPLLLAVAAIIGWCCIRRRRKAQERATVVDMYQTPLSHDDVAATYTPSAQSTVLHSAHSRAPSKAAYAESVPFLAAHHGHNYDNTLLKLMPSGSSAFSDMRGQAGSAAPTQLSDVAPSALASAGDEPRSAPYNPYIGVLAPPGQTAAGSAQDEKLRLARERGDSERSPLYPHGPREGGASRVQPEEIIVQHQDSGVIVRELPPPYAGSPP